VALASFGCADELHVVNGSEDEVGVLVDGQDGGGAFSDRGFLTNAAVLGVGNLDVSPDSNEAVGFTTHRPPYYAATAWTDGADDFDIDFKPKISVPVTVWIVKGPFAQQRQHAIDACIQTSAIWNAERMGIGFSTFQVIDATGDPEASAHFAFPNGDLGDVVWQPLRDDIGFTAGRLNIYWVDTVNGSTTTGRTGPPGPRGAETEGGRGLTRFKLSPCGPSAGRCREGGGLPRVEQCQGPITS